MFESTLDHVVMHKFVWQHLYVLLEFLNENVLALRV